MTLQEKIKNFPKSPGVYLMKNVEGKVIYVGKAQNLRRRVSDYFAPGRDTRYQINALMNSAADIEFVVTATEKEALLLEHSLIQEHKPRYNVMFKDSKRYVSIKLTSYHKFPGIYVTRQTPADGSTYFGPYISSVACREVVELITSYFKIRICGDNFFANRSRPCIQYEIKRCTAPCAKLVSKEDYSKQITAAVMFLKGSVSDLAKKLKSEMKEASADLRYEDAAHLRDIIEGIKDMIEPQAVSGFKTTNRDYIGLYREGGSCIFAVLKMRQGKIRDYETVLLKNQLSEDEALWEQFLLQFYRTAEKIPPQIFVDIQPSYLSAAQSILSDRRQTTVKIKRPEKGKEHSRLIMAKQNAKEMFYQRHKESDWDEISETLMKKLKLKAPPQMIECVDISNISGQYAVGSIVAFSEGLPDKNGYRRYKIMSKETPDDYAMMYEVLSRRFKTLGKKSTGPLASLRKQGRLSLRGSPDILLIDGGKGQLAIAVRVLTELGVTGVGLASIAKGKDRKQDQIFIPNQKNPVNFKGGPAHLFLQKIRDEAHRFGIEYYRNRHRKGLTKSDLDEIPGVGPATKKKLLLKFGDIDKIRSAPLEKLSKEAGISKNLAKKILEYLG